MAGVRSRGGPGVQEAVDLVNRAVRGEWFDFRAMSKGRFGSIPAARLRISDLVPWRFCDTARHKNEGRFHSGS
jgi:hypothetical protein